MTMIPRTQAAQMAGVDSRTIQSWIEKNLIKAKQPEQSSKPWMVDEDSLRTFLAIKGSQYMPSIDSTIASNKNIGRPYTGGYHKDDPTIDSTKDRMIEMLEKSLSEKAAEKLELQNEVRELKAQIKELMQENKAQRHEIITLLHGNLKDGTLSPWTRTAKQPKTIVDDSSIIDHVEPATVQKSCSIGDNNQKKQSTLIWYTYKDLEKYTTNDPKTIRKRLVAYEKETGFIIEKKEVDAVGTIAFSLDNNVIEFLKKKYDVSKKVYI